MHEVDPTAVPRLGEWARVVDYRRIQIEKAANLQLIPKTTLNANDALEYGAEIVVIATGSHWGEGRSRRSTRCARSRARRPEQPTVLTPEDVMVESKPIPEGPILVYDCDGYFVGAGIAEHLARAGRQVVLATPDRAIASYTEYTLEAPRLNRDLRALGIEIRTERLLAEIGPESAVLVDAWDPSRQSAQTVGATIVVTQRNSDDALYRELSGNQHLADAGISGVFQVGDCVSPSIIADAIFSGHRLAREIDSDDPAEPLPILRERALAG